jgi:hypothetical protein
MSKLGKAVGVTMALALALAMPVLAQSASTTAFDGTYLGVSRQLEGGPMGGGSTRACPLPDGKPARLVIASGVARSGSAENPMEGSVTPQGMLVMQSQRGGKFEGQIDGHGRAAGRLTVNCSYQLVWQRR